MATQTDHRVYLDADNIEPLLVGLLARSGLFVPTRLPLKLDDAFLLALRIPGVIRAIEIPMVVVGRRVPRGGSLLSAGIHARPAETAEDQLGLLRELAAGSVVNLEARLAEQIRIAVRARFSTEQDARTELEALLEESGTFTLDAVVSRGDKLDLSVVVQEEAPVAMHDVRYPPPAVQDRVLARVEVLVRGVHARDGERSAVVSVLNPHSRADLERALRAAPAPQTGVRMWPGRG